MFSPASLHDGTRKLSGVVWHTALPAGQRQELHSTMLPQAVTRRAERQMLIAMRQMIECAAICRNIFQFDA